MYTVQMEHNVAIRIFNKLWFQSRMGELYRCQQYMSRVSAIYSIIIQVSQQINYGISESYTISVSSD